MTSTNKELEPYDLYADSPINFGESILPTYNIPKPIVDGKFIRQSAVQSAHCLSAKALRKAKMSGEKGTTGKLWFDMPEKEVTEEAKLDMLALNYGRQVHPSQFYKQPDHKGLPRFFQTGRIVDKPGNLESTCARGHRNPLKSFISQMHEDERLHKYIKKRYHEHKMGEKKKKEALRRRFNGRKKRG